MPVWRPAGAEAKFTILVAPLDWGLGHTTRCIPVIRGLLEKGATIILAGNEIQKKILNPEFPDCQFVDLAGYNIRYSRTGRGFRFRILQQLPRILRAIQEERQWLQRLTDQYKLDAVISDNRYGLYNPGIPCVLITHQLRIRVPWSGMLENLIQKILYRWIQRFTECWIPDFPEAPGLGGKLSHPLQMPPVPCRYTGPLSRLKYFPASIKSNKVLILLSGPEPQRTLFEERLLSELQSGIIEADLVRGLPGDQITLPAIPGVRYFNHLNSEAMNRAVLEAGYVICRSGYSSIMDLYTAGAKPILVPTPGQTEQEYLATLLEQIHFAPFCRQNDFSLKTALKKAKNFHYRSGDPGITNLLPEILNNFLGRL